MRDAKSIVVDGIEYIPISNLKNSVRKGEQFSLLAVIDAPAVSPTKYRAW